jgi:D-glycero-alpha-D-manno-heptose-7-phosphate kinase
MLDNLHFIKQIGLESKDALESGDLRHFADLLHIHWERKKSRSRGMTSSAINECYDLALRNGARGGKLVGAGGGGFLLFYTEEKTRLRHVLSAYGLREVRWRFDFEGTTVMSHG